MLNNPKKKILQIFLVLFFVYLVLLVFLYFYQRNLLYHPNENNYSGDNLTVKVEKVKIQTSDNLKLNGWFHKKNLSDYKTIIYFHGNAGTLDNRIHKLNHFKDIDVNFLIIAWRGFGGNEGKPTEDGLYIDGKSAVNWVLEKGIKEENIVLYGESLGTGITLEIAQNKNFAGVILETPFTSMVAVAQNFYPYIPVNLLLKDRYENEKKVININIPIMIMHGEKDTIVPFSMGKKIFEMANEPKYSYFTKYDNHMMEYDENLVLTLKSFLKSLN
jgi:uncharacterized protein|tara:strand:- start:472 stop:1290 length:819 start_codon:yes stop_codon:yes gene_type:complete